VILHRPAVRNAVDPPTATALAQACLSLGRDAEIRALVLWGEGGLEIAFWCDLRVAEEHATLGVFCRRWGVPLIDGGTWRPTRRL